MEGCRYDTQLLIGGRDMDVAAIGDHFNEAFDGDCLLVMGDESLVKIHCHTNGPWRAPEWCAAVGEIYDIVVEDMVRQAKGLKG